MGRTRWIIVFLLISHPSLFAAAQEEQPDKEMLQIMEILEKWEMIDNLEMMRQTDALEGAEEVSTETDVQGSSEKEKKRKRQR